MTNMQNRFDTLNEALEAEDLLESWDCMRQPINYGQTVSYTYDDGTRNGHYVSITRFEDGRYERPVHYRR